MKQYSEEEINELMKKYKLSEAEHNEIYELIKRIWFCDQYPVTNPRAIIIGGQTGAGKSGIISYSQNEFIDNNVVVINSDEIKAFHPYGEEVAKLYPELYTRITDQESNTWTSDIFEEAIKGKYNLIFEGTMKNDRIISTIRRLRDLKFNVTVRGLAVSDLESMLSILERYEQQVESKGWGRLVVPDHHYQTYNGMPITISNIESTGSFDNIQIFKRGRRPSEPILIYSDMNKGIYKNAYDAVIKGREEDVIRVIETFEERAKFLLEKTSLNKNEDEKKILLSLLERFQEIKSGKKFAEGPGNQEEQR